LHFIGDILFFKKGKDDGEQHDGYPSKAGFNPVINAKETRRLASGSKIPQFIIYRKLGDTKEGGRGVLHKKKRPIDPPTPLKKTVLPIYPRNGKNRA